MLADITKGKLLNKNLYFLKTYLSKVFLKFKTIWMKELIMFSLFTVLVASASISNNKTINHLLSGNKIIYAG